MKVPLQEKIAELESRIVALEKAQKVHARVTREFLPWESNITNQWKRMWEEFDKIMKKVFP
jgi:hypothetical protein